MVSQAKRKAVLLRRWWHSWPLWYVGAAIVGLMIGVVGWVAGRPDYFPYAIWSMAPLVLLIGNLVFVLTISALVNLGVLAWRVIRRATGVAGTPRRSAGQTDPSP